MTSTRCAVCDQPRADHGYTAVADRQGNLGPWHHYLPPEVANAVVGAAAGVATAYAALTEECKRVVDALAQAPEVEPYQAPKGA